MLILKARGYSLQSTSLSTIPQKILCGGVFGGGVGGPLQSNALGNGLGMCPSPIQHHQSSTNYAIWTESPSHTSCPSHVSQALKATAALPTTDAVKPGTRTRVHTHTHTHTHIHPGTPPHQHTQTPTHPHTCTDEGRTEQQSGCLSTCTSLCRKQKTVGLCVQHFAPS